MSDDDSITAPGFINYIGKSRQRFLLPIAAAAELAAAENQETEKRATEKLATAAAAKLGNVVSKPRPQHDNVLALHQLDFDLGCIRVGTKYDLSDAKTLTSVFLRQTTIKLDRVMVSLSNDLLVAVSLSLAYELNYEQGERHGNLLDVLDFMRDPAWDCASQIFAHFHHDHTSQRNAFSQPAAAKWLAEFSEKIDLLTSSGKQQLIDECYRHWTSAGKPSSRRRKRTRTIEGVQVFAPDGLHSATVRVKDMRDDRRDAGMRILQHAYWDSGNRTLPNTKAAHAKLESAKSLFENLVEPIERMQTDLVLAGAMPPRDFRIAPLLLLGAPGIGKTFLATQLAEALGVAAEQISAGGAQGGFQLTGSHSSWTGSRPGKIFSLLASSESAAPVVVIDEVDKIRDGQYPVLPVLLDLLDANSSKQFHDQFFELCFDASRIIFILTANHIEHVPPALLSRVEVFHVPPPGPAQRRRIIVATATDLRNKTKRQIVLDESTVATLSARVDLDLRRVTRLVGEAFARAMLAGNSVAHIEMPWGDPSFVTPTQDEEVPVSDKHSIVFH